MVDKNIVWEGEAFRRNIRKHQIHFIHFVPNGLAELLGSEKLDNFDFIICGGERLEESIKDRIIGCGYKLYNHYGPTGITVDASVSTCGKRRVNIGTPIANVRCFILNHYNMLMPIGAPGELCIAGAGLARGYLKKPEMTFEKFCLRRPGGALFEKTAPVKHLAPPRKNFSLERSHNDYLQPCIHAISFPINPLPHSPIYRTGDLARWLPDSNIEFLGRLDDQIKISGFRIEPGEIENTLKTHSAMKDTKILAKEFKSGDRRLVAYIILNRSKELGLFYESFSRGPTYSPPLADISFQYADFTVWQRNWFQENEETLNRQLSYWKEQLKNVPAFLSFPTDKPRPHVQTFNGANFHFLVPQNLFGALRVYCLQY